MKTLEQAARMALEALQLCANGEDDTMLTRDTLAALSQALEQSTVKDCLKVEPKQEQEPYCWKVLGVASEFTGYYAEEEAKATAKRMGGTREAFPLYVAAQPAAIEQEPVAWISKQSLAEVKDFDATVYGRGGFDDATPLYTEPPKSNWQEIDCPCCGDLARAFPPSPKREWVGLTDKERYLNDGRNEEEIEYAKAIEAKLKEKNT